MKEGWKTVKLGEVCEKITDGSHNPPKGIEHSNYFMLSSQNVQDGYLLMDSVRYLSKEDFELENKRTKAQKGDILLTIVGTIGRTCVLTGNEGNITFQRSVALMKPIKAINSYYLMYYFLYQNKDLNLKANGAAQKGIYLKQLIQYPVILPPLEEQHRIVSILDASFEKIDALKKNAEENLKNAKALFQQVLAQELKPKEGWVEKRLDEIATFYNGKAHEQCIDENGKYILVNSKYISSNTMVGKRTNSQLFPLYKDDIVMVMSDVPNGKALAKCLIIPTVDTHSLNQRICVFRNSKINVKLLYYLINRNPYLLSFNNGENQTNLRKNDILKMRLSYPTNEAEVEFVLNRLDEQINLINEFIENKEQTIRECDALKQSILHQAFSGKL